MDEAPNWFLMKHDDGTVFGPIRFEQLRSWALDAQVSPLDKVSTDERTWTKAPMIPELEMDFLIEVTPDQYYGPTTMGAVREFLEMGEISGDTILTNCKDGSERLVKDVPELRPPPPSPEEEQRPPSVRTSIRASLQARVRELEEILMEERRARQDAELRCERLEARLAELSAKTY
jgi:peptidoglycan hydrolase-like protein with peptidoglycan-binding domain